MYTQPISKQIIIGLFLILGYTLHAGVYKYDLIDLGSNYELSNYCNPSQQDLISINIDSFFQIEEGVIYKITEGQNIRYYLIQKIYSYGDQGLPTMQIDNIERIASQSSLCQDFSPNSNLYIFDNFGDSASYITCQNSHTRPAYYNIDPQQGWLPQSGNGLQVGYVYEILFSGESSTRFYKLVDILPFDNQYSSKVINDIIDMGDFQQFCLENSGPDIDLTDPARNNDFEYSFGQWSNDSGNPSAWKRNSGSTPTSYTGPSGASSGSDYMYAEANDYENNASLESDLVLISTDNSQFSFDYYMFGQGMGDLGIEISLDKGNTWSEIWRKEGDQGPNWYGATIDLSDFEYKAVKLRFRTDIGRTFQSDIAIDNLQFSPRTGPVAEIGNTTLDQSENYVYQVSLRDPVSSVSAIDNSTRKIESVTYYDGLGRPKQSISMRGGGFQEDIITPIVYDGQGREKFSYLPFAKTSESKGDFVANAIAIQGNFYDQSIYDYTTNPYNETVFDSSPLNLVLESGAPGSDWAVGNHTVKNDYDLVSLSDYVRYYSVVYNSTDPYQPTLVDNDYFMAQYQDSRPPLMKFTTKNENWQTGDGDLNTTQIFVDHENRTLLKRQFVEENGTVVKVDTYYVYDDYGNLIYVLTPESNASSLKPSQSTLDKWCYQYKYDGQNRIIEKKLPGIEKEYIVYNKLGKPIMTQDGELRKENNWKFTKYDELGRVIYTGIATSTNSRATLQSAADNLSTLYDSRIKNNASPISINGAQLYYTNSSYPSSIITEIWTINYYDQYLPGSADGYTSIPGTNSEGEVISNNTKGLATVSRTKILDHSPSEWITTTNAYEKYGRIVWTKKVNDYLGTTDVVQSDIDFDGSVLKSHIDHDKAGSSPSIDIEDFFTYDHMGRLKQQSQIVNSQSEELILRNFYDELGQLENKQVGGSVSKLGLQNIDFSYNVRGWLKGINDVASMGNDLFAFKLNYNTPEMGISGVNGLYNGNISETIWRTAFTGTYGNRKRGYGYNYDGLDRINNAYFRRATSSGSSFTEQTSAYNVTGVDYDLNGNIQHLNRQGVINSTYGLGTMDALTYTYDGNQLTSVNDTGYDDYGFIDRSAGTDYEYDDNGNMKYNLNKGLNSISYNDLNLPTTVYVQNSHMDGVISYEYSAAGEKVEKFHTEVGSRLLYDGGFVYSQSGSDVPIIKFYQMPEGYVEYNGSTFDYIYQYKDHLGNIRLSYRDIDGNNSIDPATEILDEKDYYPFGMLHDGYNYDVKETYHNYGYLGKEEQSGTDWLDLSARNYDSSIGRFMNMDPLSEERYSVTPYNYSQSSPLLRLDSNGMLDEQFEDKFGMRTFYGGSIGVDQFGNVSVSGYEASSESGNDDKESNGGGKEKMGNNGPGKLTMGVKGVELVKENESNKLVMGPNGVGMKPETPLQRISEKTDVLNWTNTGKSTIFEAGKLAGIMNGSPALEVYGKLLGVGLGALSITVDFYKLEAGSISSTQFYYNSVLNSIMTVFPEAAMAIMPGKYLGEKYEPEIYNQVTDPSSRTTKVMTWILHGIGLPASAEEEPYTPWWGY